MQIALLWRCAVCLRLADRFDCLANLKELHGLTGHGASPLCLGAAFVCKCCMPAVSKAVAATYAYWLATWKAWPSMGLCFCS